jgi:RNA polymerase sigma factor (sigma-70 family)
VTLPPFQAVLEEHRADVFRYLVATVGAGEADDCLQETLVAALRAYPALRHGQNLRAWLFRIAQRKAVDFHRARARRELPSEVVAEQARQGIDAPTGDGEPALWQQVRRLPDKQRAAVFLRCVLGTPYPELAEALDCSQAAARRSVHEGLGKLRKGAPAWTTSNDS